MMNIEYAKTIPMREILSKLDLTPVEKKHNRLIFPSIFDEEKRAVFTVNTSNNTWFDQRLQRGGDGITFVCLYLQSMGLSHTITDALRWLKNMMGDAPLLDPIEVQGFAEQNKRYLVRGIYPLAYEVLQRFVESRGIPRNIASERLKQITVFDKIERVHFPAVGFENEDGGFEFRSPCIKASAGPMAISFIRGLKPKPDGIHIFNSAFDYLSIITQRKGLRFDDDATILNCLSNMKSMSGYIRHYEYRRAYLWLDNTEPGEQAKKSFAKFFSTEPGLDYVTMNQQYEDFRDVNAQHMHNLGLTVTN